MLHPDAPEAERSDPDAYAKWRIEHLDEEENAAMRGMPIDKMLQLFRDEWHEALESDGSIESEEAEIDLAVGKVQRH